MSSKSKRSENQESDEDNKGERLAKLLHTINPGLFIENTFGIFRFQLKENELVPIGIKLKLAALLITTIFCTIYSVFRKYPVAITGTAKDFDPFAETPDMIIIFQYTACVFTSFIFTEANIKIIKTFFELDTSLRLNITDDFYNKSRKETLIILALLMTSHTIFSCADVFSDGVLTVSTLVVLPIYFVQDLEVVTFYKLTSMLKSRLVVLNDYLKKYVRDKDGSDTEIYTIKVSNKDDTDLLVNLIPLKVKDLATMYDTIGENCSRINDTFNFQIFMTLVSTFTYVIVTIWSSLSYFRTDKETSDSLIRIGIWCVRCVCTVAVLCFACERLLASRNETKILVNDIIMDYDLPPQTRLQAKAFMELIEAWPLKISVYDMFYVDITLMLNFISVATTYLIVIIQISHFIQ